MYTDLDQGSATEVTLYEETTNLTRVLSKFVIDTATAIFGEIFTFRIYGWDSENSAYREVSNWTYTPGSATVIYDLVAGKPFHLYGKMKVTAKCGGGGSGTKRLYMVITLDRSPLDLYNDLASDFLNTMKSETDKIPDLTKRLNTRRGGS